MSDIKVMDLVVALLQDAAKHFPTLIITSEIVTISTTETVLRIVHHKAINNEYSWMTIIPLTELWQSYNRAKEIKPVKLMWALCEYGALIHEAVRLGLFKLKDFALAT